MVSFCLLAGLIFVGSGCGDDDVECREEPYPLLDEVALEALRSPETFDDYVNRNRAQLDGQFNRCLQQRIALYYELSEEEKDLCADAHVFGSDDWNNCIEEAEQAYDLPIAFMSDLVSTINGTPFLQTDVGGLLSLYKQLAPELYDEVVLLNEQVLSQVSSTCEICN